MSVQHATNNVEQKRAADMLAMAQTNAVMHLNELERLTAAAGEQPLVPVVAVAPAETHRIQSVHKDLIASEPRAPRSARAYGSLGSVLGPAHAPAHVSPKGEPFSDDWAEMRNSPGSPQSPVSLSPQSLPLPPPGSAGAESFRGEDLQHLLNIEQHILHGAENLVRAYEAIDMSKARMKQALYVHVWVGLLALPFFICICIFIIFVISFYLCV